MYPIDKYRYYKVEMPNGGIKTIAVSTYAGKTVRGVAICAPGDTYDENKGKELAAARCELRVAEKRYNRAHSKVEDMTAIINNVVNMYNDALSYQKDSAKARDEAESHLMNLLDSM